MKINKLRIINNILNILMEFLNIIIGPTIARYCINYYAIAFFGAIASIIDAILAKQKSTNYL